MQKLLVSSEPGGKVSHLYCPIGRAMSYFLNGLYTFSVGQPSLCIALPSNEA